MGPTVLVTCRHRLPADGQVAAAARRAAWWYQRAAASCRYRAHVAAGPQTGIITDEKLAKAPGEENRHLPGRVTRTIPTP